MATDAKSRALEIVQERRNAYDQKVTAGNAIPHTFQFHIRHNGRTDHRINWSYGIETNEGPRTMLGKQEFQTF
jgi:hypothetical protein